MARLSWGVENALLATSHQFRNKASKPDKTSGKDWHGHQRSQRKTEWIFPHSVVKLDRREDGERKRESDSSKCIDKQHEEFVENAGEVAEERL